MEQRTGVSQPLFGLMALGPGIPHPPPSLPVPPQEHRHRMPEHLRVVARPIFGGLHHEYGLEKKAA